MQASVHINMETTCNMWANERKTKERISFCFVLFFLLFFFFFFLMSRSSKKSSRASVGPSQISRRAPRIQVRLFLNRQYSPTVFRALPIRSCFVVQILTLAQTNVTLQGTLLCNLSVFLRNGILPASAKAPLVAILPTLFLSVQDFGPFVLGKRLCLIQRTM